MIYAENILLCMIIPLVLTMFFLRGNANRFVLNFILGMVACLLGAYVSGFIDAASGIGTEDTAVFISPVVEEMMKFLPLLFYFVMFAPEDDKLTHAALGMGAGFASYENICSMVSSGTESLSFVLVRGLAVGVMHIVSVFTLIMGLIIVRRFKVLRLESVIGALSLSMLFHGMYNLLVSETGISSIIGFSLPMVTAAILYYFYRQLRS
ncbi:MAG: PrsW family intramembrane metalloprotease [Lachnospiraceae bacterium]|nr:PrsW family intramembrane metalloprotease [Lachnospiraceae bacterium]